MQNNLLQYILKKTAYSKQFIYAKELIIISFKKTAYSKQLIYTKNLLGSLF